MIHENEAARWTDEPLRAAIRELRTALLGKATGEVPAARDAWTEAAQMLGVLMERNGIDFEEPQPDQVDITPAAIERLLDEAELSPGEITPGARAMLMILRWLSARAPEAENRLPIDNWIGRAATLYDRDAAPIASPVSYAARPASDNPTRQE